MQEQYIIAVNTPARNGDIPTLVKKTLRNGMVAPENEPVRKHAILQGSIFQLIWKLHTFIVFCLDCASPEKAEHQFQMYNFILTECLILE